MKLSKGAAGAAVLSAAALAGLLAVPGTAGAAVAGTRPAASITVQSATIAAGTRPQVTFITAGAPVGAVVYVQKEQAGQPWRSIGRIGALSGTVDIPADPAGSYEYRLVVASGSGSVIVTSAPVSLTVTSANGGAPAAPAPAATAGSGDCTGCGIVSEALPWLALIVDPPTIWATITSVLSDIGGAILAFIGL